MYRFMASRIEILERDLDGSPAGADLCLDFLVLGKRRACILVSKKASASNSRHSAGRS